MFDRKIRVHEGIFFPYTVLALDIIPSINYSWNGSEFIPGVIDIEIQCYLTSIIQHVSRSSIIRRCWKSRWNVSTNRQPASWIRKRFCNRWVYGPVKCEPQNCHSSVKIADNVIVVGLDTERNDRILANTCSRQA